MKSLFCSRPIFGPPRGEPKLKNTGYSKRAKISFFINFGKNVKFHKTLFDFFVLADNKLANTTNGLVVIDQRC